MKEACRSSSSEMKGSTTSVLENRCVRQRILEKIPNSMSFWASLLGNRVNRLQGRVGKGQEPHGKHRKHKRNSIRKPNRNRNSDDDGSWNDDG